MAVVLDQFILSLSNSGLMSGEDIQALLDGLAPEDKPQSGEDLAKLLYRRGKLTRFQAEAVYRGKTKALILGDYVVEEEIGQGGMGQVYKARHRRMKRIVALKMLPPAVTTSPDAVQRFQREVEAAAKLIHPHIVTAFDAGESGGVHFLVMEYVEGQDLGCFVQKEGPLDIARAVDYTRQAAEGLEYAHGEGVVHRDIKPANLLLDKKGTVKILDMGLARLVSEPGANESTAAAGLTQSGQVMGTVDYMSPEQALDTRSAGKPADVYSLGCTLFYLLTGKAVYQGNTLVERILAHREQPIPSLRKARADVPRLLDTTFRKMVAKKPELRQRSMREVIEALAKCGESGRPGPISTRPTAAGSAAAETLELSKGTVEMGTAPGGSPTRLASATPTEAFPRSARPLHTPRRVAVPKRTEKQQSAWDKAVKAADRDYKRRHGIGWANKLRRWLKGTTSLLVMIATLVVLLGIVYYGVRVVWQNVSIQGQCRQQILEAIGPTVHKQGFEPVSSLSFTNASALRSVPDVLDFEASLIATTSVGRRPVGKLTGQLERSTGRMRVDIDRFNGADVRGLWCRVEPVP